MATRLESSFLVFCLLNVIICQQHSFDKANEEDSLKFDIEKNKDIPLPSCHWNYNYNIGKTIVATLCFAMGAFILVLGYKKRRVAFCFTGLMSVSILTYMVVIAEANYSMLINILISVAVGLFASLCTTTLLYCGYFITGLFAGFIVGFTFLLVYTSFSSLNSVALPCVIIATCGLVQVFVTVWWRHRVLIISSCMFSSAVMASAMDYVIEDLFLFRYMEMKIFYNRVADMCWWSYLVFGLWALFFIIGLLVQCLLTGKERQKETYRFIYRKKTTTLHVPDDQNHLIRCGPE